MFATPPKQDNRITVVIPYNKNAYGLVYTLALLQNQSTKPDKIVIIDTSINKGGLAVAKMFSYGEIPIVVEIAQVNIYEAWNRGIELAGDSHVFIINDDVILPINIIQVMRYVMEQDDKRHAMALAYVPQTSSREHQSQFIDQKLQAQSDNPISVEPATWMPGFCFLLTKQCIKQVGVFDTKQFTVWFGDTDYENRIRKQGKLVLIKGIFVYHFGGLSYRYGQREVQEAIKKDRLNYNKTVRST